MLTAALLDICAYCHFHSDAAADVTALARYAAADASCYFDVTLIAP